MAARLLVAGLMRRASAQAAAPNAFVASISPALAATGALPMLASPMLPATAARAFSATPLLSESLASVIKKEIKHEKANYEKPELVAKGPPAPFTLAEAAGDTTLTLTREYKGETVRVDASVNLQDAMALPLDEDEGEEEDVEDADTKRDGDDDDDDDGEFDDADAGEVSFNVTVSKGARALVFECVSDGTFWDVRHVSLEPASGVESETAYTGPVFQELDEELQVQCFCLCLFVCLFVFSCVCLVVFVCEMCVRGVRVGGVFLRRHHPLSLLTNNKQTHTNKQPQQTKVWLPRVPRGARRERGLGRVPAPGAVGQGERRVRPLARGRRVVCRRQRRRRQVDEGERGVLSGRADGLSPLLTCVRTAQALSFFR